MNVALPVAPRAPFESLSWHAYGFIMADPCWTFKARSDKGLKKSAQMHYVCRDLDWIKALPVADLAAKHCALWLWATNPMIKLQLEVAEAWGFKFSTMGAWIKTTKPGWIDAGGTREPGQAPLRRHEAKICFGTGHVLRGASEPFLICTRGAPKFGKSVRSAFLAPRREHSRKPDEAYGHALRLVPGDMPRADLFARQVRPGWDGWGDEINLFQEQAA